MISVNGEPHLVRSEFARYIAARSSRGGNAAVPSVQVFAERAGMSANDVVFLFDSGALVLPPSSADGGSGSSNSSSSSSPFSLEIPPDAVDFILRALDERSVLVPLSAIVDEIGGSFGEPDLASMALATDGLRCMLRDGRYYLTPAHHARLRELIGL